MYVFKPPVYNPPVMLCPSDEDPMFEHSYLLNDTIASREIKLGSRDLGGLTPSEFIVMGEKKTHEADYYSGVGPATHDPWVTIVYEGYRHGPRAGSNYLFLDWHVEAKVPDQTRGIDPWSPLP